MSRLLFLFALVVLASWPVPLRAQAPAADPAARPADALASMQQLLVQTTIEVKPFQKPLPLPQFLAVLEKQLPEGKKVELDFPAGALAIDLTRVPVQFPPQPARLSLLMALQKVVAQLKLLGAETAVGITAERVVLTTPQRAAYTASHDVRHLIPHTAALLPLVQPIRSDIASALKGVQGPPFLRLIVAIFEPKSAEILQFRNGTTLVVQAIPARQEELGDLLDALRRLLDVAVVMNARLHEVDRDFFTRQLAPLLAAGKESGVRPVAAVSHDAPALKLLRKQKLLVQGEDVRIRPGGPTGFLSLQEVVQYNVSMPNKDAPRFTAVQPTRATTGVSFLTGVEIDASRRFIRLQLTQKVEQPGEIRKVRYGDAQIGFEEIEEPTGKSTTLTTTVTIPDGVPILMPVEYQPPGAEGKNRVWVLLAEPRIYIEEEEALIRQGLIPPMPRAGR